MKFLITILAVAAANLAFAQGYYGNYDWAAVPEKYTINLSDTTEDEEILLEKNSVEFFAENEQMIQINLTHVITAIKTDAGIEMNNKVYVSNTEGDAVITQKARVIKPNGTILELKQSDIQESKDENGEVEYRYFAPEGLEKGCVIEYFHYIKGYPDYTGLGLYLQSGSDKRKVEMDIISPTHLDFVTYSLNGMPEFELDSTNTDVRRKFIVAENVKALKDEYQSPYSALLQKCYYKLNKNFDSGKGNFYNYTSASKIVHEQMFTIQSKGSLKKIKALAKDMMSNGGATLDDQVRYMEYKLKTEYNVANSSYAELTNMDFVLKNKVTSEQGMVILFLQILREAGVKFELVLTSDRDVQPFITEFEGYNFLSSYLIYINDLDAYFAPGLFSRVGFPPYENTYNKGLFIQEKQLDGLSVPITKVKEIKLTPAEKSKDNITALVDFTKDVSEPVIEIEREVSGYKALYPQAILDLLEEDRKKIAKDEILIYIDKDSKLENVVYKNDNSRLAGVAPLSAKATFVGMPITEAAGDNILFKIGMLIGPQAESYNKEERTLPVQTEFAREYNRTLKVMLPEGMKVKNLEALMMEVVTKDGTTGFKSSYELNGNVLVVTIQEFYQKVYYPVVEYKGYEDVINAAADFNKIVLVLEKL